METRFPGTDWFCDNCGTYLNDQKGFDDRKYIWQCKKCGYKNSISAANIRSDNPLLHNITGFVLGYIRSFLVYISAILFAEEIVFGQPPIIVFGHDLLLLCGILYPLIMAVSLFFERSVAKYGIHIPLVKWAITTIFVNFFGDFIRPLQEILSFPFALANIARLKIKRIPFKKYFIKKCLYALAYLVLLLLIFAILSKTSLLS